VEADCRCSSWQSLDLDISPADPANPEAQNLGNRFLGGPSAGQSLGSIADVGLFCRGQYTFAEAIAEASHRLRDTGDMDDVDPEFGRALWRGRKLAGSILAVGIDAAGIAITRSSGLRRSP
jgi:hypothetical protein